MTKKKYKRVVGFRCSDELYKKIKERSIKEKKTVSVVCEGVIWLGLAAVTRLKI